MCEGVILHVDGGERRKGVRKQWLKVKLCCELTHTPESLAYQTALYAGSRRDRTREARKRSVRRCHCKRRVVHGRGKMSLSRTRTSGWAQEVSRRVWAGEGLGMARGNGPRHEHATGFGTGLVPEPCSCRTSHYQGGWCRKRNCCPPYPGPKERRARCMRVVAGRIYTGSWTCGRGEATPRKTQLPTHGIVVECSAWTQVGSPPHPASIQLEATSRA